LQPVRFHGALLLIPRYEMTGSTPPFGQWFALADVSRKNDVRNSSDETNEKRGQRAHAALSPHFLVQFLEERRRFAPLGDAPGGYASRCKRSVLRPVAMPFDLAQCRNRDPGLNLSTCVEPVAHSFLLLHSFGLRSPPKPRVNLPRPWRENS